MKLGFTKKSLLIILAIALIFLGFNFWGGSGIKSFIYGQSLNWQSFFWKQGNNLVFGNKDQQELNKELIQINQRLLSQLADLDSLKKENQELRQALNFDLKEDFNLIMAEVTAKNNINIGKISYGDSLLINKGAKDGIKKGFAVVSGVSGSKVLLGKIVDVYDNFSRVLMISGKESIIDVQIQDSPNFALAKGQGNQKIVLDMFPKNEELKQGALVMTSALGSAYPSGLVIGTIGEISSIDSEAFKKAEINPAYNLNTLNTVFVIKNIIVANE
jgi:rod shape-determining protein MreC